MVNEFKGGLFQFSAQGSSKASQITGETWLANFGISDLGVRLDGMYVLVGISLVLMVATYLSLALQKYVK
jgi:hypothetical protein